MPVRHKVTTKKTGVAALTKTQVRAELRESIAGVGAADHRIRKKRKHYQSASRRYGHAIRDPRYVRSKFRKKRNGQGVQAIGDPRDFVWSGRSKALLMANNRINAVAPSSREARVDVFYVAPQFNLSKLSDGTPLRDEWLLSRQDETEELFEIGFKGHLKRLAKSARAVTTTAS